MKRTLLVASVIALLLPGLASAVSLTGYYKLDDTSLSTASATIGTDGTYSTGTNGFVTGDLGQAGSPGDPNGNSVNFPTIGSQKITIPSAGGITDGDRFSISMWVQFAAGTLDEDQTLASNGAAFNTSANLLFWRDEDTDGAPNNTLAGFVNGSSRSNGNDGAMNDSAWHLVALTFDRAGADEQLYIDGENITATSANTNSALSTALDITLGNVGTDNAARQFFGLMDEVGFWDRALTDPEMDALHFLSGAEEEYVTDAQGAAALFDFFEDGSTGDTFVLEDPLGFRIVDDVTLLGGTAGQSVQVGDQLLIGLSGNAGLASFVTPEPTSVALWTLLGLIGFGFEWHRCRAGNRKRT